MLISVLKVFGPERLEVITVNHNIRPEKESGGDAEFVRQLCRKNNVNCTVFELEKGKVKCLAEQRRKGIEEAARFLRYEAFNSFLEKTGASCICLAHNADDNTETLLMRFLKGSGTEGNTGIRKERGKIFRPLLEIRRCEIEEYLKSSEITWRTDSTNQDNAYLRNKIRNIILPCLDENIEGFRKSLLLAAEKNADDEDFISSFSDRIEWQEDEAGNLFIPQKTFLPLADAVIRRVLYRGVELLDADERLPYRIVEEIISWKKSPDSQKVFCNEFCFCLENKSFFIKKNKNQKTETSFFAIIERESSIVLEEADLNIRADSDGMLFIENTVNGRRFEMNVRFPLVVRSPASYDVIADKDGSPRSVLKILKNWHVSMQQRSLIPVVEEGHSVTALAGSLAGFPDWIVARKN
ncbi:MAG: tRNA lysidine(34) synthetase TilS [Treponema sp.]|nr:tRNA lysidine(34) synthetase TilS [Treponema sp.]